MHSYTQMLLSLSYLLPGTLDKSSHISSHFKSLITPLIIFIYLLFLLVDVLCFREVNSPVLASNGLITYIFPQTLQRLRLTLNFFLTNLKWRSQKESERNVFLKTLFKVSNSFLVFVVLRFTYYC